MGYSSAELSATENCPLLGADCSIHQPFAGLMQGKEKLCPVERGKSVAVVEKRT